jgi:hypothetical protein
MRATRLPQVRVPRPWTFVALVLFTAPGCVDTARREIDDHALLRRVRTFEAALVERTDAQKLAALAAFAGDMLHRHVRVRSGTVVAVYERGEDWNTRPFFGFDYVEANYIRLVDLDPEFYRQLHGHRYWASVSCIPDDRQLMFELAVDGETHARLQPGQHVSFTCEVAGIIRGKTVYSRLATIEK